MPDFPEFKTVFCKLDEFVLTVTLNRPEKLNAFNGDLFLDVARIAEIATKTSEVRVVIFTGAGRAFSSGADLSDISERRGEVAEDSFEQRIREAQKAFDKVEDIPMPTIAAINGHAVGAGLQLALACDFRIAVRGAKLGLSDVKIGIIPALGATKRLPRLIGLAKSKELILTGDLILSEDAHHMGLLNQVVEKDNLEDVVSDLGTNLAARAPLALEGAKELLNRDASAEYVAKTQARLFKTSDAIEGITSFLEKRSPVFKGS